MKTRTTVTARWLSNVTQHYLERRFTSSSHLKRLLRQRVDKVIRENPEVDRSVGYGLVDAEIARLLETGQLNDEIYAADKARSLHTRGGGERKIRAALFAKGVSQEAGDALDKLEAEIPDAELEAARTFARKRRIGPWRAAPVDPEGRQKEIQKMGRGGFSYRIALEVIDGEA